MEAEVATFCVAGGLDNLLPVAFEEEAFSTAISRRARPA